jgi:DNA-binding transcriptional MerR regulator
MTSEGIMGQVRRMVPTRYTITEAAKKVGRSTDTLRRWQEDGTFSPDDSVQMGKLKVRLYTDADIERLRKIAKAKKPGRPKKTVASDTLTK